MNNFIVGFFSSISATIAIAAIVKWAWPAFKDKCLYNGVRVNGTWDITEFRNSKKTTVGRITLSQTGSCITGNSTRSKTRDGKESERQFNYRGTIRDRQVTLLFEDVKGVGFDTGTYVFTVQNDSKTMIGMATFHGKKENKIVSETRTLTKVVT